MPLHLIYLKDGGMLLSRKQYADWRDIQEEYEDYLTSLGPFTPDGLSDFLSEEYGADDAGWGFSREELRAFVASGATVLKARGGG